MRRLYLLRHATAEAWASGRGDHARELTASGITQAHETGLALETAGIQLIVSSSATRAVQTAEALGLPVPIEASDDIYNAPAQMILEEVMAIDEAIEVALVVGHAPGIPSLAHWLATEDSEPSAVSLIESRFPTCTLVGVEFEGPWAELEDARLFMARLA